MYKYLLSAIIISIFTACSGPKPTNPPAWYTSMPKDFQFFYSVGSGKTITHAKNNAIVQLRKQIQDTLNSTFSDNKTKLKIPSDININEILSENERFVNTMSLMDLKIEKTEEFNGEQLILLKLPRTSIFTKLNILASKNMKKSKAESALVKESDPWIKQFSILSNCMQDYPKLASLVEAKKVVLNSHNNLAEINYLNELSEKYLNLKNELSIYVISDINSRAYVQAVKDALSSKGIELSEKPKSDKSLKLYITSTTENIQDYGFNRSKSLVKYSTYDLNKKKILFKQHTFSAKSRKSYSDAKIQTVVHQGSKIKKLGIFDFLGVR